IDHVGQREKPLVHDTTMAQVLGESARIRSYPQEEFIGCRIPEVPPPCLGDVHGRIERGRDQMIEAPSTSGRDQVALRLRPPGWRDPRLLTGIVLVAISVALGSWLVAAAGRTVPVFVADGALTPGDVVTRDSLRVVDARLRGSAD